MFNNATDVGTAALKRELTIDELPSELQHRLHADMRLALRGSVVELAKFMVSNDYPTPI